MSDFNPNDLIQIIPPISRNYSIAEVVRLYLAQNGMVAIDRELAESMAGMPNGIAIYDPSTDTYLRRKATELKVS